MYFFHVFNIKFSTSYAHWHECVLRPIEPILTDKVNFAQQYLWKLKQQGPHKRRPEFSNLKLTKDESLARPQWCLLRIAHNYPLPYLLSLISFWFSFAAYKALNCMLRKVSISLGNYATIWETILSLFWIKRAAVEVVTFQSLWGRVRRIWIEWGKI